MVLRFHQVMRSSHKRQACFTHSLPHSFTQLSSETNRRYELMRQNQAAPNSPRHGFCRLSGRVLSLGESIELRRELASASALVTLLAFDCAPTYGETEPKVCGARRLDLGERRAGGDGNKVARDQWPRSANLEAQPRVGRASGPIRLH